MSQRSVSTGLPRCTGLHSHGSNPSPASMMGMGGLEGRGTHHESLSRDACRWGCWDFSPEALSPNQPQNVRGWGWLGWAGLTQPEGMARLLAAPEQVMALKACKGQWPRSSPGGSHGCAALQGM